MVWIGLPAIPPVLTRVEVLSGECAPVFARTLQIAQCRAKAVRFGQNSGTVPLEIAVDFEQPRQQMLRCDCCCTVGLVRRRRVGSNDQPAELQFRVDLPAGGEPIRTSMYRMCFAFLISISLALPGLAIASPGHHQHMQVEVTDHQHSEHHGVASQSDVSDTTTSMLCCNMIEGHCASVGVHVDSDWDLKTCVFGLDDFSIAGDMPYKGQSFETDPPPPRP